MPTFKYKEKECKENKQKTDSKGESKEEEKQSEKPKETNEKYIPI